MKINYFYQLFEVSMFFVADLSSVKTFSRPPNDFLRSGRFFFFKFVFILNIQIVIRKYLWNLDSLKSLFFTLTFLWTNSSEEKKIKKNKNQIIFIIQILRRAPSVNRLLCFTWVEILNNVKWRRTDTRIYKDYIWYPG